jgi:hypothetical protein
MPIPDIYQGARLGQPAPQLTNNANANSYGPPPQQQGIDPATVQAMLALQQQQPEMEAIGRQRKLADMLRQGGKAQLQGVQAGRMYRAPTALNAAASIFSDYAAQDSDRQGDERVKALGGERQEAVRRYFEAMRGG